MVSSWARLLSGPAVRLILARSIFAVALFATVGQVFAQGPTHNVRNARVEVEGRLEHLHEDWPTGSRDLHFLQTSGGERLSLRLAADQASQLRTGQRIRVRGVRVGQTLTQEPGTSVLLLELGGTTTTVTSATSTTVLPNTLGEQRTLVILVNFQDNPTEPYTLAYASSVIFGTTNEFILENSYGQTRLTGDVVGWYTIPLNSTVCDTSTNLAAYAENAAAAAGIDLSAYTRYIYAFPKFACGWWGLSTVGGNPSRAYINGGLELEVVGHELGHNLGLLHSHSWVCSDGTTLCSSGTRLEYGDGIDLMGWSPSAHYNAFQKERLGWLKSGASPAITTVRTAGTYTLETYETPGGANPKALKILKNTNLTTGYSDWYYVEFRQAIGFDSIIDSGCSYDGVTCNSGLNYNNILDGVLIHWGSDGNGGNTNILLDLTPETWQLYSRDPALAVGRSFSDPDAGVIFTAVSVGGTGAAVSVALSAPGCNTRSTPTVALSPSQSQAVPAGAGVTYAVSVTNNDGASCPAASFTLGATVPTGWTATFAAPTLTVSPGNSTSTTLTVTSPASAVAGSYTILTLLTNDAAPAYWAQGWASYLIGSALNVSVSTDKSSYTRGQTVYIAARVISGGSPVSNASVRFTMTKSDGTEVSQTSTTDSTGSAVGTFRLRKQNPTGSYKGRADAAKAPLSGSAATSFTVTK